MEREKYLILIAEDDALVRKTTAHYLSAKGYRILEAVDGQDALKLFRQKHPDILLTDLRMPLLDGMDLIKIVIKEAPGMPVIIFSGMGTMIDVIDALRVGAWDYLIKPIADLGILDHSIQKGLKNKKLLKQERDYQASLEQEVQVRTEELLQHNKTLEKEMERRQAQEGMVLQAQQEWERTFDAMPDMIAIVDSDHNIIRMNKSMLEKSSQSPDSLLGTKCYVWLYGKDALPERCFHTKLIDDYRTYRTEIYEKRLGGHCELIVAPYFDSKGLPNGSVHIVRDINEYKMAELEKEKVQSQLLHAQKLESVGQLAAGIAHEINTPTQFIGTNIDFLDEASHDILHFMKELKRILKSAAPEIKDAINTAIEEMDWEYLADEMPLAISQSREGVQRVTSIVRAMKEFSHPGGKDKESLNLNNIINTTVTIARNEWKYVADLDFNLDEGLPDIPLLADEMGQVILNMLVNAAHAIADKLGENPDGNKGTITISTSKNGNNIEMHIQDTGAGMPEKVRLRIFDPFYTTKKVGKGTGQGLAISHDVIVEKHLGAITVESTPGVGTKFIISLPIKEDATL